MGPTSYSRRPLRHRLATWSWDLFRLTCYPGSTTDLRRPSHQPSASHDVEWTVHAPCGTPHSARIMVFFANLHTLPNLLQPPALRPASERGRARWQTIIHLLRIHLSKSRSVSGINPVPASSVFGTGELFVPPTLVDEAGRTLVSPFRQSSVWGFGEENSSPASSAWARRHPIRGRRRPGRPCRGRISTGRTVVTLGFPLVSFATLG